MIPLIGQLFVLLLACGMSLSAAASFRGDVKNVVSLLAAGDTREELVDTEWKNLVKQARKMVVAFAAFSNLLTIVLVVVPTLGVSVLSVWPVLAILIILVAGLWYPPVAVIGLLMLNNPTMLAVLGPRMVASVARSSAGVLVREKYAVNPAAARRAAILAEVLFPLLTLSLIAIVAQPFIATIGVQLCSSVSFAAASCEIAIPIVSAIYKPP